MTKWLVAFVGFLLLWVGLATLFARAEEIHQHDGTTAAVDKFYSNWKQPDEYAGQPRRLSSCCNRADCYVPERIKRENGKLYFLRREDNTWVVVPVHKIEQNYDDAVEAPDGRNHVCAVPPAQAQPNGHVYCFTFGSGV